MAKVTRYFVINVKDVYGEEFTIELDEKEFSKLGDQIDDQFEYEDD